MPFVLHRGPRADVLADALAEVLADAPEDPFTVDVVAVHSKGVERWLAHRLSARLGTSPGGTDGVCANLELPFPGRLVHRALAAVASVDADADPWRPNRLAWPLLDVLEEDLAHPYLRVVAGHLGAGGVDGHRRLAVVRHLADLFDRYAVHRPAMVRAWADGRDEDGAGEGLTDDLAWQAELWRRVRERIGVPGPAERLDDGCRRLEEAPALVDLPDRFSLFGITRLPAAHVDVLRALALHREVHLFALHPSPAAWARAARRPRLDEGRGGPKADLSGEGWTRGSAQAQHPLLRAWGRDSLELHGVLSERLAGSTVVVEERTHDLPAVTGEPTLLHRLQAAIRDDVAPDGPPVPVAEGDRSVQVHACHGRARQAEVVRDAILHLLAADKTLEPRDVVVLCPDIDEMAPLLRAAFAGAGEAAEGVDGPPAIPFRLADRSIRETNPVLGAVAALLALADGRLTASQVLAFADLEPVRRRFDLDDDDLDRMAGWIRATGTRWGLDASHRAPYGLATVDAGTWAAGLRRLLLGVAMSEDGQRVIGDVLPLDDVDAGDIDLAGRVAELVDRLGAAVRDLAASRPIGVWCDAVHAAADALLATTAADAWQRAQLDGLLRDVQEEAAGSDIPVQLVEVRDLLRDRLRGQPTRAAFRTGALTLCTLVPMRSVPHRIVCLVGLDDGCFPRGGGRDGDDLLGQARWPGDPDRRTEDLQLLLDAVLAAGDALVVTYIGRDARTNEELPPAVPVAELLDVLAPGDADRSHVLTHHPLRPDDERCFTDGGLGRPGAWGFEAFLEAGAAAARQPLVMPTVDAATRVALLPDRLPDRPAGQPLLVEDLVAFVQHPVRAFLRQRLGLSLGSFDDRPVDALPVELDQLGKWAVADRLLDALLAGASIDEAVVAERARGLLPPGALGVEALEAGRRKAARVFEAANAAAPGARTSLDVDVRLTDGRQLVGTVPDVVGDVVRTTTASRIRSRQRGAAYVRFLAAVAAQPDLPLTSATVGWGQGPTTVRMHLGDKPTEERRRIALARLAQLVDLWDRGLREPLPLPCATSYEYAVATKRGDAVAVDAAEKEWKTGFNDDFQKEDKQPEHLRAFGRVLSMAELVDWQVPLDDEVGTRWDEAEPSRFGRLALRLWMPVLSLTANR